METLRLRGLSGYFGGHRVLGPLDLTLAPGEQVALVGRSGAGKSTLIRLIHEHTRTHSALVPQALGLVEALPVFHNVYMGRLEQRSNLYNIATLIRPFRADREAVARILAGLDMSELIWRPAGSLSGGQKQRVAIARAMYRGGDLLLADEPVSALDGPMATSVMTQLQEAFAGFVVALHDVELALAHTQRIIGIHDGKVVLDAPSRSLTVDDIRPIYD